ncbi:hypothetical protein PCANC_05152 [Puccinia coronata f. sp. avenae]|uniref:Uncharacterized protein n=1 Tax=Puccinia coronata f. sp. avenae TaxID=200324 RepID=A0A2N5W300_9BASI|nr:hypothetical protein PCANC_05152 [Puccinia coronata f. sp. avenae]
MTSWAEPEPDAKSAWVEPRRLTSTSSTAVILRKNNIQNQVLFKGAADEYVAKDFHD